MGKPGQGIRGCGGEEHGLGRFRGFFYQDYITEGCRADEPTGSMAEDHLHPASCLGYLAGQGGDRQGPWRSSDGDQDQGVKACGLASGRALVARGARVDVRLLGYSVAASWADEVVGIRGPDLFVRLLRRLPEGDVQLVLAQLLDGDGQGMLRTCVDLRARDAEGIVEAKGRGVLVDLARPLGAGHGEAVAGIHLVQKLVYLKVVQHLCLLLLSIPSSRSCPCGPARGLRL